MFSRLSFKIKKRKSSNDNEVNEFRYGEFNWKLSFIIFREKFMSYIYIDK